MLRPDCKPGPLESRPARFKAGRPAIKPAGPIINRCKRLAGFKAGRADLQPGPAYNMRKWANGRTTTAERHKQERRSVVPARVALAITREEAWCRLELR